MHTHAPPRAHPYLDTFSALRLKPTRTNDRCRQGSPDTHFCRKLQTAGGGWGEAMLRKLLRPCVDEASRCRGRRLEAHEEGLVPLTWVDLLAHYGPPLVRRGGRRLESEVGLPRAVCRRARRRGGGRSRL